MAPGENKQPKEMLGHGGIVSLAVGGGGGSMQVGCGLYRVAGSDSRLRMW